MVMSVILIINIQVYDKAFILQLNHIFMGQNQLEKRYLSLTRGIEYTLSNQKNCGNRFQTILLIKFNKLELSNN